MPKINAVGETFVLTYHLPESNSPTVVSKTFYSDDEMSAYEWAEDEVSAYLQYGPVKIERC